MSIVERLIRAIRSGITRREPERTLAESEHTTDQPGHPAANVAERQLWTIYTLIGGTVAQSALVLLGNVPRLSAWLLTLLALGIGQGLLLPSNIGWFGGLAVVVLWVLFRQATGTWVRAELVQSLLESIGLSLNVVLAVRYRQVWQQQQHELQELRALREVLVAGEVGTGLLPREVGELRMLEEVDRARLFRRPLGLLLVELEQLPEPSTAEVDFRQIYQAVARQLASASLVHDIPFRVDLNRTGLIMPEREWDKLYEDAESIVSALRKATLLDREERLQSVLRFVKLNFGLGTYQGEVVGTIDLLRAAEDSLSISRDLADLGEAPVSAYAMPAAPIVESKLAVSDEEE
ncbi:MAG: hypothetical protein E3J21_19930 [Anaerolineales bacterium]|nr:MAG: hypothetical protein E3J21_19930 [Anaerolineales bacterium]